MSLFSLLPTKEGKGGGEEEEAVALFIGEGGGHPELNRRRRIHRPLFFPSREGTRGKKGRKEGRKGEEYKDREIESGEMLSGSKKKERERKRR